MVKSSAKKAKHGKSAKSSRSSRSPRSSRHRSRSNVPEIEDVDISEMKKRYGDIRVPSKYKSTPPATKSPSPSSSSSSSDNDDLSAGMYLYFIINEIFNDNITVLLFIIIYI